MSKRKLDILIPQYKETYEVIKSLLDSIALQQNVDLTNDVGVIIVNDGSDVKLSEEKLRTRYPFFLKYIEAEHRGVSATRNRALDESDADYVMFCDADDMFYNLCGLYIIFREINNGGFDTLISAFVEETRNQMNKNEVVYITHQMDSTFVHGKVHNRNFLKKNKIRWNDNLTIHEDSYFNCLCQKIADPNNSKFCPTPFYLWKWRDESVCRHDPLYLQKTYNNMLESSTALVNQFLKRKKREEARFYATAMIYDAYFSLNCDKWLDINNKEYRDNVEIRFKQYWRDFKKLFKETSKEIQTQIAASIRNRFYAEGLLNEKMTFEQWIEHIEKINK